MTSLILAFGTAVFYLIAYNTYGRWLSRKIFRLDPNNVTPAHEKADGHDYVASKKEVVFGHHYTSIAGTGPIVGPAIAIIWGWVPALVWILLGSVFMGAVHDFGALAVSLRNQGRSIGDVCKELINKRVRILFLLIIFFLLLIVIAIFGLVIASLFKMYPQSVFPVWFEIPIALCLGWIVHRKGGSMLLYSIIAVILMYVTVIIGAYFPFNGAALGKWFTTRPVFWWTIALLIYAFIASVLPVHRLLQPRDFINSHQLFIAIGLLILGIIASRPEIAAPKADLNPSGSPSFFPFIFITLACGAISGFHALVSSGTSAKQVDKEPHAQLIGYGSMLTEGFLAVLVIITVAAGLGIRHDVSITSYYQAALRKQGMTVEQNGRAEGMPDYETVKRELQANINSVLGKSADEAIGTDVISSVQLPGEEIEVFELKGRDAWNWHYREWAAAEGLGPKVEAFVEGAANMLSQAGIPWLWAVVIMGVFVASFAGTTLDTATRLQRYVITELASDLGIKSLTRLFPATLLAVGSAALLALWDGQGAGAMILWPLFGTANQLLAALALLVITIFLFRAGKPVWVTALPMIFMLLMTGWALLVNISHFYNQVFNPVPARSAWHLLIISLMILVLEVWMLIETFIVWRNLKSERRHETA